MQAPRWVARVQGEVLETPQWSELGTEVFARVAAALARQRGSSGTFSSLSGAEQAALVESVYSEVRT
jgi:hypothetical protein